MKSEATRVRKWKQANRDRVREQNRAYYLRRKERMAGQKYINGDPREYKSYQENIEKRKKLRAPYPDDETFGRNMRDMERTYRKLKNAAVT